MKANQPPVEVVVSGPPGIGKTYLIAQIVQAANLAGFDVTVDEDSTGNAVKHAATSGMPERRHREDPPGTCTKYVNIRTTNK